VSTESSGCNLTNEAPAALNMRGGRTWRCGVSSIRVAVTALSLMQVVWSHWIIMIARVEVKYSRWRLVDDRTAVAFDARSKSSLGGHGERSTAELQTSALYRASDPQMSPPFLSLGWEFASSYSI
jgi:hypothetical protein